MRWSQEEDPREDAIRARSAIALFDKTLAPERTAGRTPGRTTGRSPALAAGLGLALAAAVCGSAVAGEGVLWNFDVATDGADTSWTSPTAVATDAPRYDISYELTLIEVTVSWSIFEFTIDATEDVPPELRTGGFVADGPLPIVLIDDSLVYPPPPESPSLAADVGLLVDAAGFGQLAMTNVVLGELEVDLGPPFGFQTVQLEGIRVAGQMGVQPLGPAGDVSGNGIVDFEDLLLVLAEWGACPVPPDTCPTDTNGDGVTDFQDLLRVLAEWS